eukprot:COSAG01_NODE_564_length_15447_cov_14.174811_7_plen_91_part_00
MYQQPLPLRQRGTALQRRSTCPYAALTPRGKPLMVAGARASAHTFRLRCKHWLAGHGRPRAGALLALRNHFIIFAAEDYHRYVTIVVERG